MKAIRFHYRPARYLLTRFTGGRTALGPLGSVSLDDVPEPELPGPDWVRIDTSLSGICGSDLSALTAHDSFTLEPFGAYPFTFGHENVGRVAQTGSAVHQFAAGDRVVINPMLACRQRGLEPPCPACARGEYGLCRRTGEGVAGRGPMIGYSPRTGGGWSRSFVAHVSQLHSAEGLGDDVAVLTDPYASALRGVLLQPPREDDVVLVIGAGTIGLLAIRALRAIGWMGQLVVQARYPFQRDVAMALGASRVVQSKEELYDWAGQLPQAHGYKPTLAPRFVEGGPSLVYDTVGTEASLGDALALTREGGRLVLIGAAARVRVDFTRLWYRQISLAGIFAYGPAPYRGQHRDIYEVTLDLLRADGAAGPGLVTHVFGLEEYRAAIAAALDKGGSSSIKVAFRPTA